MIRRTISRSNVLELWPTVVAFVIVGVTTCRGVQAMDVVRAQTHTDEAVAQYGVSGAGVIVAILDRGIDWTHPDFRHPDGTTRIKWLLDMTGGLLCDPSEAAPVEYSEADINAALLGKGVVDSRDAVGHGTATTGIAAGNGSAAAGGKYRGMAPQADLIIVKLLSDGAPAHDRQPEEVAFQGCIEYALSWLDQKIDTLGEPCVALINSGVQWGPIDGTSAVSRKIDEVFGLDRPGRAYVAASGDEGDYPNHAGGNYTSESPTDVAMVFKPNVDVFLSAWYTGGAPAEVTITCDDGTVVGPVGPGEWLDQDGVSIFQYDPGQAFYPWQSSGRDRGVWMRIAGHAGPATLRFQGTETGTGHFDLYHARLDATFISHLVPGRLTDYSATLSAIVTGAHVARTTYVDVDGATQVIDDEGGVGEFWTHSAAGPTRDGRPYGVDINTPGHNVFAAYAPNSYWATFTGNMIQDGLGWYGRGGATSGAAPITVGAVALMFDACPLLTARQARQILHASAEHDSFTGPTPNLGWGWGKLNVLKAMQRVQAVCLADLNGDGRVNGIDLALLLGAWTGSLTYSPCPPLAPADLNQDCKTNGLDLALLLGAWG